MLIWVDEKVSIYYVHQISPCRDVLEHEIRYGCYFFIDIKLKFLANFNLNLSQMPISYKEDPYNLADTLCMFQLLLVRCLQRFLKEHL